MSAESSAKIWHDARWLLVQGADAHAFLQGYLTCDTTGEAACRPMAMCNLKGRVVANGWVTPHDGGAALIIHASLVQTVRDYLRPYLNFSRCELTPEEGFVELDHAKADRTLTLLPDLQAVLRPDLPADYEDASAIVTEALVAAGFALVSEPVSGRFLPQVLGLDRIGAVDFDKGCYLGQEIVARAQFRGAVKRHLITFAVTGDAPQIGAAYGDVEVVISHGAATGLGIAR